MFDKECISKNRIPIMGVAALWIMIFHGTINIPLRGIDTFIKIGYLGVDIFMFMSGFSMWNSYCISCKGNNKDFIKRRLKKILPTFLPFAIIWVVTYILDNYNSFEKLKVGMRTKTFWITMVTFRWFVPCILLCYMLSPVINIAFVKFGYKFQALFLQLVICALIAIPFVYIRSSVALMILLRIPEYIIGWYYGATTKRSKRIVMRVGIIILMYWFYYFLLGRYSDEFLCDTGLYWWPAIMCVSSIALCLSRCNFIDNKLFNFCGTYSLELYLWHVYFMFTIIKLADTYNLHFDSFGVFINVFSIIFACVIAYLYKKIIDFCVKL